MVMLTQMKSVFSINFTPSTGELWLLYLDEYKNNTLRVLLNHLIHTL